MRVSRRGKGGDRYILNMKQTVARRGRLAGYDSGVKVDAPTCSSLIVAVRLKWRKVILIIVVAAERNCDRCCYCSMV